jgi:virginiamycin B lyase
MPTRTIFAAVACVLGSIAAGATHAGGSNYGVAPGARTLTGKISEWAVPTPRFARDPAPGPDGNVYISVMQGNKIARFDTRTQKFNEWQLPAGARPHGLVVDSKGIVWYTGNGNGTLGELDPATGKVIEHKTPSGGGGPHTPVIDAQGNVWFTGQAWGYVGKFDRATRRITEYPMVGGPYGLSIDREGNIWVCRMADDKLGRIDPKTGAITELSTGPGSRPRRIATAPNGMLWVTLYGNGKLAKVDPAANKVVKYYDLPAGRNGGPYAVTVDGSGRVFANELDANTVTLLDPETDKMTTFKLPTRNTGIRKSMVDAEGRFWFMGSHSGKLGVIE